MQQAADDRCRLLDGATLHGADRRERVVSDAHVPPAAPGRSLTGKPARDPRRSIARRSTCVMRYQTVQRTRHAFGERPAEHDVGRLDARDRRRLDASGVEPAVDPVAGEHEVRRSPTRRPAGGTARCPATTGRNGRTASSLVVKCWASKPPWSTSHRNRSAPTACGHRSPIGSGQQATAAARAGPLSARRAIVEPTRRSRPGPVAGPRCPASPPSRAGDPSMRTCRTARGPPLTVAPSCGQPSSASVSREPRLEASAWRRWHVGAPCPPTRGDASISSGTHRRERTERAASTTVSKSRPRCSVTSSTAARRRAAAGRTGSTAIPSPARARRRSASAAGRDASASDLVLRRDAVGADVAARDGRARSARHGRRSAWYSGANTTSPMPGVHLPEDRAAVLEEQLRRQEQAETGGERRTLGVALLVGEHEVVHRVDERRPDGLLADAPWPTQPVAGSRGRRSWRTARASPSRRRRCIPHTHVRDEVDELCQCAVPASLRTTAEQSSRRLPAGATPADRRSS